MEVVVTTGGIRYAKLQSNRHHQHLTVTSYRPDTLPVGQPAVVKGLKEKADLKLSLSLLTAIF